MDLSALHSFLRTKEEANAMLVLLEKMDEYIFKSGFSATDDLLTKTSYQLKSAFEKIRQQQGVDENNPEALKAFFSKAAKKISQLPTIHIILSFPANESVIELVSNWFFDNYKQIILLDISTDPSIIGGLVISFKGKAQDYTLATKIEQIS